MCRNKTYQILILKNKKILIFFKKEKQFSKSNIIKIVVYLVTAQKNDKMTEISKIK